MLMHKSILKRRTMSMSEFRSMDFQVQSTVEIQRIYPGVERLVMPLHFFWYSSNPRFVNLSSAISCHSRCPASKGDFYQVTCCIFLENTMMVLKKRKRPSFHSNTRNATRCLKNWKHWIIRLMLIQKRVLNQILEYHKFCNLSRPNQEKKPKKRFKILNGRQTPSSQLGNHKQSQQYEE